MLLVTIILLNVFLSLNYNENVLSKLTIIILAYFFNKKKVDNFIAYINYP